MRISYHESEDALFIRLDEGPVLESEEVQPGLVIDFNADGQPVGIELRGAKANLPTANLKQMAFEVA
jgi:uncharacterized protein YuzE